MGTHGSAFASRLCRRALLVRRAPALLVCQQSAGPLQANALESHQVTSHSLPYPYNLTVTECIPRKVKCELWLGSARRHHAMRYHLSKCEPIAEVGLFIMIIINGRVFFTLRSRQCPSQLFHPLLCTSFGQQAFFITPSITLLGGSISDMV